MMAGFMTTLHPCPFAINISAISILAGMASGRKKIILAISYFIFGYLLALLSVSIALSSGLLSIPYLSIFLQNYINLFIGPLFILAGMLQANLINSPRFNTSKIGQLIGQKRWSGIQALPLGFIIALSFCPATAAIFFGLLIPMAVEHQQIFLFPSLFALGAAFPIIATSIIISRGYLLHERRKWRVAFPVVTGWILIVIGIYLSIQRIFLG